jgi:hypothetical protein
MMIRNALPVEVYLEIGQSRTFAVAIDWPGWCRSGRDETSALRGLYECRLRYARVMEVANLPFHSPSWESDLVVVERLAGNATTDFGAPALNLSRDALPVNPAELQRWQELLDACWQAFDAAVWTATGKNLSKGPRGGGRDLDKIVQHVIDADLSYLAALGGKLRLDGETPPSQALAQIRQATLSTLAAAARGEIPTRGPRGGLRWSPHFFVRRHAWHVLDHAWEIEDRVERPGQAS